ncbi:MAG: hypothetical protein Q9213_000647 [Squamulea squamosa]
MTFIQAPVTPLPLNTTAKGKTVVITGASSGLGLETARQILRLGATTVVLAVRDTAKGEARKASLLEDQAIKRANNRPMIMVMKLDMEDYASVQRFCEAVRIELPALHYLVLNAGIAVTKYKKAISRHERSLQVNYLSNAHLLANLLPLLEATAIETGVSSRVTWIGRRKQTLSSLEKNRQIPKAQSVLKYMDQKKNFKRTKRYRDSKLLCIMFMHELAPRLNPRRVCLNMVYPGMVHTDLTEHLTLYQRYTIHLIKSIRARTVEKGTWLILHALLIAGLDSHGKLLENKELIE